MSQQDKIFCSQPPMSWRGSLVLFSILGLLAGMAFNVVFGAAFWDVGGLLGGVISGILLLVAS